MKFMIGAPIGSSRHGWPGDGDKPQRDVGCMWDSGLTGEDDTEEEEAREEEEERKKEVSE